MEGSVTGGGSLYNPYLRGIHDANGVLLADTADDNGGAVYNSRVTFTPEEDAVYYVAAAGALSAYGYHTGTYTVSVTDVTDGVPDDYEAGTGTSGTVAVGGSTTGDIEFDGDRDWFAVDLEADKTYRINLDGSRTRDGYLRDPYLRGIHDANGDRLAGTSDDNSGRVGSNSRVYFAAEEAGAYYVVAGAIGELEGHLHAVGERGRGRLRGRDRDERRGGGGKLDDGRDRDGGGTATGSQWSSRRARATGSTWRARPPGPAPCGTRICAVSMTRTATSSPARRTTTAAWVTTAG